MANGAPPPVNQSQGSKDMEAMILQAGMISAKINLSAADEKALKKLGEGI